MDKGPLLFRADASTAIGTGHVMRCLALAQAWQDAGGAAVFALAQVTPAIEARLRAENMQPIRFTVEPGSASDAAQTVSLARELGADWMVVDGYQFGSSYQNLLKEGGLKVLFVDDNGHCEHYSADLVLNQNVHASPHLYLRRERSSRLLLGPRYALLRREFNRWRGWKREIQEVGHKVLVTMGGSDPNEVTGKLIDALRPVKVDSLDVTVVVAGGNPNRASLERSVRDVNSARIVEAPQDMSTLLAAADVGISAAGSTTWEMCAMGLPALLLVIAENQSKVAIEMGNREIAVNLGNAFELGSERVSRGLEELLCSPQQRAVMSERARRLVDGRGVERVMFHLNIGALQLRPATDSDCRVLWEWANEPDVRSSAFSSAPIPWEHHVEWFRDRLNDSNSRILIAVLESGVRVGQVRFQKFATDEVEIDISIARDYRSEGLGRWLIDSGTEMILGTGQAKKIHAFVKTGNKASARAFEMAGFVLAGTGLVKNNPSLHYVRNAKNI